MNFQILIPVIPFLTLLLATSPEVRAHGGAYRGPPYPTVPPLSGPGSTPKGARGGSTTPRFRGGSTPTLDTRKWETWWALYKDEFFPIRGITAQEGSPGYDPKRRPPTPEEVALLESNFKALDIMGLKLSDDPFFGGGPGRNPLLPRSSTFEVIR